MAEDRTTPKHGRHAAPGKHAASRPQESLPTMDETPATLPVETPSAEPVVRPVASVNAAPVAMAAIDTDQELQLGEAPAPIGIDPGESGSFSRITAAEGARVTTRANASETASFRAQGARPIEAVRMSAGRPHVEHHETAVEANGRVFAILGIGALLVVGIIGWLLARAVGSVDSDKPTVIAEQVQAGASDAIEYRGVSYVLVEQAGGTYALTSKGLEDDQEKAATLCELKGTPVALILYDTAFIMPENLPDGTWDLVAYHLGGGSVTQRVTGGDGNPIIEKGEIASASLVGDDIQVKTTEGESYTVSLKTE